MSKVLEAFAAIAAEGPPSAGIRYRSISEGIDVGLTPDDTRLLIVDVEESGLDDRSSTGIWLLGSPQLGTRIANVLECRNSELDGVFTHFCERIVTELEDLPTPNWHLWLRRRLSEWRELFSSGRNRRMSRESQVGLWGELIALRTLHEAGSVDALASWVASVDAPGPDFRWDGAAMEVKTTTSLEGFDIHVNGLGQLDPGNTNGRLLVTGVRAVEDPGGETLPQLVEKLLAIFPPEDLLGRLRSRQYQHDPQRSEDWIALTLREISTWLITADTPRLDASLLPAAWRDAISEVTYTLSAAALGEPLDGAEVWQ